MPGYAVQTLQTLQLWGHPLNLEAFKNVKSLKVFRSNHFFIFFLLSRLTLQLWAVMCSVAVPWIAQCWGEVFYMNCSV